MLAEKITIIGLDIHTELASRYYGVPCEEVTKEQRTRAKTAMYVYLYIGDNYTLEEILNKGMASLQLMEHIT